MEWHALRNDEIEGLEPLALRYNLHPLHLEDCRHGDQSPKLEENPAYTFIVLKSVYRKADGDLDFGDLDIFLGPDFLITFEEHACPASRELIARLQAHSDSLSPGAIFYKIFDALTDSYVPILDHYSDEIDTLEDAILANPEPTQLPVMFAIKRGLIEMRRILTPTRDLASHLQRSNQLNLPPDLLPYFRDIYDHLARNIDTVEMLRDLLNGSLDIYLSSVANRTNQVMKVLTILSTVAIPALVISGFYGMNFDSLPGVKNPHGAAYAMVAVAASSAALLAWLRWARWL